MCINRFIFTVTLPLDATAYRNRKANIISAVFCVPAASFLEIVLYPDSLIVEY